MYRYDRASQHWVWSVEAQDEIKLAQHQFVQVYTTADGTAHCLSVDRLSTKRPQGTVLGMAFGVLQLALGTAGNRNQTD